MQAWTSILEQRYMRTKPAERCAAEVEKACNRLDFMKGIGAKQKARATSITTAAKIMSLKRTVDRIQIETLKVGHEAGKLQAKMGMPASLYSKIPGLGVMSAAGTLKTADSDGACRKACNKRSNCKAYSFNKMTLGCSWSTHKLEYDDNYYLYIKVNGKGLGHFQAVPGMKLGVDTEYEGETGIADCKYECLLSDTCSSVSYSRRSQHCVRSQVPISIGSHWDYYEKKGADSSAVEALQYDTSKEAVNKKHEIAQAKINASIAEFRATVDDSNAEDMAKGYKPYR